jgi:(p)ppGpp synthase/HD superfamily hydrolase
MQGIIDDRDTRVARIVRTMHQNRDESDEYITDLNSKLSTYMLKNNISIQEIQTKQSGDYLVFEELTASLQK